MSFNLRRAAEEDKSLWYCYDAHIAENEFIKKTSLGECFVIEYNGKGIGVLRYNLFWDSIPFLTMIFIDSEYHRMGLGKKAMEEWENRMRALGYDMAMTSTQADEEAQHFYRKIGYTDCGCLVSDLLNQPTEIFMIKKL